MRATIFVYLALEFFFSSAQAAERIEVNCHKILLNYTKLASQDKTLPGLFKPTIKFKPDHFDKLLFETENIVADNGDDFNITCRRSGTLYGFDLSLNPNEHPNQATFNASAKKFLMSLLLSMNPDDSTSTFKFVNNLIDKIQAADTESIAPGHSQRRVGDDFGATTSVMIYFTDGYGPTSIMIDRSMATK